jgi:hypothetical protein
LSRGGGGFGCGVDVFDDDVADGFVPGALGVDQGAGADGVEDVFGAGRDAFGVLGDVGAGDAHIAHAALVEAGGASVAIDGAAIGEAVLGSDLGGDAPVEEVVFDFEAVGVTADGAAAGVAGEFGAGALCGRAERWTDRWRGDE